MRAKARFLVLWSQPNDPEAFQRHYREIHIPLAAKLPGLRRYTLGLDISAIRGSDRHYMIGALDFDDMDSLRAAFASSVGQTCAADVAKLEEYCSCISMVFEIEEVFHPER